MFLFYNQGMKLSSVPIFETLSEDELTIFANKLKKWDAPTGTVILEEGREGNEFYIILEGKIEILRARGTAEESHLGMRQPGEVIGEMGLIGRGTPRTATAVAVIDSRLLIVTYEDFNELLKAHPELGYELARVLSARLTEALNRTISYLHSRNEELQQAYDELKEAQDQIIEKEKLELSLQTARKIQFSILPAKIPQPDGYDIGALMEPAQAVGGDFYGIYQLDDNNLALVVGDVSDKGMPAAIFMAQCHALLRASIQNGQGTVEATERVNKLLLEMNAQGLFVTLIYGILKLSSGEFRYTRAGHELPMILDAKGELTLPEAGTGGILGVWPNAWLKEKVISIPRGGLMVLYSDGVPDSRKADWTRFGEERFMDLIKKNGVTQSAQKTCQMVFDALIEFHDGAPQYDDITLLAVRRF